MATNNVTDVPLHLHRQRCRPCHVGLGSPLRGKQAATGSGLDATINWGEGKGVDAAGF